MNKCKLCGERYTELEDLHRHLAKDHADEIPKDFSPSQFQYALKTGKIEGKCVVNKKPTKWNESTNKYQRFCSDPKCKEIYREKFKQNMIGKHGKIHLLNDPDHQRAMLANRSISGKYLFGKDGVEIPYTGSYELDFLKLLDIFMEFDPEDIMSPSPHTYYYEYEGERKFYIPDLFIPSLNLEIEIKDGGDNPNMHHKIQNVDKKKEQLKDAVLMSQKDFSYIKIVNKNYDVFFEFLHRLKKQYSESTAGKDDTPIFIVRESVETTIPDAEIVTEATSEEAKYPVFIFLTYTNTNMAKAIRFFTGDPYSHASISFDSSMQDVYSFGRKFKDDRMTFINENIHSGILKDVSDQANYSLYVMHVTKEQRDLMQKRLDDFKRLGDKLKFSIIGLINVARGKETSRDNEYFCSQFVAEILKAGTPNLLKRDTSLYNPYDLVKIKNVNFVARGKLKNYNKRLVDEKVRFILRSESPDILKEGSAFEERYKMHQKDAELEALGRYRTIPGLPSRFRDDPNPYVYFGLSDAEKNAKEINYLITRRYSLKGLNLSLDGLKRFLLDNNLSHEVRYYSRIPVQKFYIDNAVDYDSEYDMIAALLPFRQKLNSIERIPF